MPIVIIYVLSKLMLNIQRDRINGSDLPVNDIS
jgi:hypothetical protein